MPVWGWSPPGTEVQVLFGDQRKRTRADDGGTWSLTLDPLEASHEERTLRVTCGDATVAVERVLVGEVWLASGQSNMQWLASKCNVGRVLQRELAERVVLTAPGVTEPRGVAYGTAGIGWQPNLYNQALLPMTPFIVYDQEHVTRETWPDDPLQIAGVTPDPASGGLRNEWRKMPILSTQFRDNGVLQAGVPITFWGSVLHDHGFEAEGEGVIEFRFGDIERTIPVMPGPSIVELGPASTRFSGGKEWRVTVPAMEPSDVPRTLSVTFKIDGEVAHERVITGLVVGDVWVVAASQGDYVLPEGSAPSSDAVRVLRRRAKRWASPAPSRYSIAVSRTPKTRYSSAWLPAEEDLPGRIGALLHARTGHPVGVIFLQSGEGRDVAPPPLASWIPFPALETTPGLEDEFTKISSGYPGYAAYDENMRRYVGAWRSYWSEYVPAMISERRVPDGAAWGVLPARAAAESSSSASQAYNCMVHSFTPAAVAGIVFLSGPGMVLDEGELFGDQLTSLVRSWKDGFGSDPPVIFTQPSAALAPRATRPTQVQGRHVAVEIDAWSDVSGVFEALLGG